ncbi:MAG: hypothetical protein FWD45_05830, partial [Coriobacteriia bacterium]|nr:hypothetical protein [Coriobacteriia bacterium]
MEQYLGLFERMREHNVRNYRAVRKNPYYVHRKPHACPFCAGVLAVRKVEKVDLTVEERSEAGFGSREEVRFSPTLYSYEVFYCAACDAEWTISDVRAYERET